MQRPSSWLGVAAVGLISFGCSRGAEKPVAAKRAAKNDPAAAPAEPLALPFARPDTTPAEPLPPALAQYWPFVAAGGFRDASALRTFLVAPEADQGRAHAWVDRALGDAPAEKRIWQRLAAKDPADYDAQLRVVEVDLRAGDHSVLDRLAALVARTARLTGTWRGTQANFEARHLQCLAAIELDETALAKKVCFDVLPVSPAKSVLEAFALLALSAKDPLVSGRAADGVVVLERNDADLWFIDATAFALGLHPRDAKGALEKALWVDPRHEPSLRTYTGLDTKPEEQLAALKDWRRREYLDGLRRCAIVAASLGLDAEAQPCLAALDATDGELGRIVRLEGLSISDPAGAAGQLSESISRSPLSSAAALAVAAKVDLADHDAAHALPLAEQALRADPVSLDAEDAVLAAGGHPNKPLPRVSKQHDIVTPATLDSIGALPPFLPRVVLAPYGDRPIPELEGLAASLHETFPQVTFTIDSLHPLPADSTAHGELLAEAVLAHTLDQAGRVAIVDQDLVTLAGANPYGWQDPYSSRAVVSVSRLRSADGRPADPSQPPSDVSKSRTRLQEEIAGTLGRLLGMSSPCLQAHCALRSPHDLAQFDADGTELCSVHREELARIAEPIDAHPLGPDGGK